MGWRRRSCDAASHEVLLVWRDRGKARVIEEKVTAVVAGTCAVGCQDTPRAYASALVVVDTDLPAPGVLSRLQVDVYDGHGHWAQSRRFAFTTADGWPASFGVELAEDERDTAVLVRLRGYPEDAERDYRGERFVPKAPYVPVPIAISLAELCAAAPELPPFETKVLRAGPQALFTTTCDRLDNEAGSVAAHVTVRTRGSYRFEALSTLTTAGQAHSLALSPYPSLHLVKDCTRPGTFLACDTEIDSVTNTVAKIVTDLEPGSYSLVTGSAVPGSIGDVALRWAPAAEWGAPAFPPPPIADDVVGTVLPLQSVAEQPRSEPSPDATVDRLVVLHLRAGAPGTVRVTLRGACAGTMAKLAIGGDGTVDAASSETCIDDGALVKAPLQALEDRSAAPSARGTYAASPCPETDPDDERVCVPGGALVLGSATPAVDGFLDESPRRIAGVSRFLLDRHEYTVARYRAAVARGLDLKKISPLAPPLTNDGPINEKGGNEKGGTFSSTPLGRESFPLTMVTWYAARTICQFEGGDLPTEAQWERAASYGGHVYPWGDDTPTCASTVAGRSDVLGRRCAGPGPVAVGSAALAGDVSVLGIVGLAGNVSEHVLGSSTTYDSPCYRGAVVLDGICLETSQPTHVARGGEWRLDPAAGRASLRRSLQMSDTNIGTGFRCAYPSAGGRP